MNILDVKYDGENRAVIENSVIATFGKEYGSSYQSYEQQVLDYWLEQGEVNEGEIEEPFNEFPRNDIFEVVFQDHEKWSESHVSIINGLIQEWDSVDSQLLDKARHVYTKCYKRCRKEAGTGDLALQLYEDPTDDFIRSRSCIVQAIYINLDSGKIGVSGSCLWEEEHGFGLLLSSDMEVEKFGYADVAFNP